MADPNAQSALENLKVLFSQLLCQCGKQELIQIHFDPQEFAKFLKVLGSYPTGVSEG
jgi:hypothetical protein